MNCMQSYNIDFEIASTSLLTNDQVRGHLVMASVSDDLVVL
jgi:hypothetical protein